MIRMARNLESENLNRAAENPRRAIIDGIVAVLVPRASFALSSDRILSLHNCTSDLEIPFTAIRLLQMNRP